SANASTLPTPKALVRAGFVSRSSSKGARGCALKYGTSRRTGRLRNRYGSTASHEGSGVASVVPITVRRVGVGADAPGVGPCADRARRRPTRVRGTRRLGRLFPRRRRDRGRARAFG